MLYVGKISHKGLKNHHIRTCKNQVLQKNLQYCYSAILKVELHCSSFVKKKKNLILLVLTLSIPLSLTPVTRSSPLFLSFFLLSFSSFSVHSFNPSPSLIPFVSFIFFPLYFPLNQGFDVVTDGFDVGLMWWSSWV